MENAETIDINDISAEQWKLALQEATKEANAIATNISPPGSFRHLSKLLDDRRREYGIIDAVFTCQPIFNAVWVFQIELNTGETFVPGGVIVKSEVGKLRERQTTSRGVLVGAGLTALDELKSHGVEPGHIVRFIKQAPFMVPVGYIDGKQVHVLQMRSGDILASEDLSAMIRAGVYETRDLGEGTGSPDHRYVRTFDQYTSPVKRLIDTPEDY